MEMFILLFLVLFSLGYASSSSVSLNNCNIMIDTRPITLMENEELEYIRDMNMTIETASCYNEISKSKLLFVYGKDSNNKNNEAVMKSEIVGSKSTEGKWNCEVHMEKQCRLKYSFTVTVKYFHVNINTYNPDSATIVNEDSNYVFVAKESFRMRFQSDNEFSTASCRTHIHGNDTLDIRYSTTKNILYCNMTSIDKLTGPWKCIYTQKYGARRIFELKVVWETPVPTTITTERTAVTTETFKRWLERVATSTTTERTAVTTETFKRWLERVATSTIRTTESLPSGSTGPPIALTKSTTEATTNNDTQVQWWKAVVGVAASLLIIGFIIGIYVYRRKKKTTMEPQPDDSAPQPDGPSYNERVYYTIDNDDDLYYSYAYCNPKPTDSNAAANTLYDIVN